jgi:hypothetical protein
MQYKNTPRMDEIRIPAHFCMNKNWSELDGLDWNDLLNRRIICADFRNHLPTTSNPCDSRETWVSCRFYLIFGTTRWGYIWIGGSK